MRVKLFKSGDLVRHSVWRDYVGIVIDVNPRTVHSDGRHVAVRWFKESEFDKKIDVVVEDLVEKVNV
jgi:heat shock protein HspQ